MSQFVIPPASHQVDNVAANWPLDRAYCWINWKNMALFAERGIVIEFPTIPGTIPQLELRLLVLARRAKLV